MAVSQSSTAIAGGGPPPDREASAKRSAGARALGWLAVAAGFVTVAAIVIGLAAGAYQPLGFWNQMGGFPGLHRPAGAHIVNDFGQDGQLYIPHQHRAFAASVSLVNNGPFPVTIEAVSMSPPRPGPEAPAARGLATAMASMSRFPSGRRGATSRARSGS